MGGCVLRNSTNDVVPMQANLHHGHFPTHTQALLPVFFYVYLSVLWLKVFFSVSVDFFQLHPGCFTIGFAVL